MFTRVVLLNTVFRNLQLRLLVVIGQSKMPALDHGYIFQSNILIFFLSSFFFRINAFDESFVYKNWLNQSSVRNILLKIWAQYF